MDTSARARLNLVFGQATGSALVLLAIDLRQRMLEKQSLEVEPVSAPGATVPRITPDTPVGLIGEPAAILQAAEGSGLRNIASLSRRRSPLHGRWRLPRRIRARRQIGQVHGLHLQEGESLMGTHTSIALAFGATLMFAAGAVAQQPAPPASSPYNSPAGVWPPYGSPDVTLGHAKKLAEAAEAEARKNGWKMAIAVVSNEGSLIYFGRMEDTQFGSSDIAIRKAKTAAEFRRPTKEFQDAITGTPPVLLALSAGPIAIEGGLPLLSNGKIIGAIGCSGGTPGQDEQVCKAVVDTIK